MQDILKRFIKTLKKRAMAANDIEWELYQKHIQLGIDASYPIFYLGENENYLVFVQRGKLYRVGVMIENGITRYSEPQEIVVQHIPVSRSNIIIKRTEDGLKFAAIAGSATLNRSFEIDSKSLFDSLVESFDPSSEDYIINFYHETDDERYWMGKVEHLERSGNLLLACGTIDETTLFGREASRNFSESDKWGVSIEFYPLESELVPFENNVEIRSYTRGKFHGMAIVLEEDASHFFTNIISGENGE